MQTKEELIHRLFLNQCTREELEYLLQIIKEDPSAEGPEIMTELFRQLGALPDVEESISDRIYRMVEEGTDATLPVPGSKTIIRPTPRRKVYWWVGSAAAAVLLLICSIWVLQNIQMGKEVIQQTAYGEVGEFFLPDSSLVVLNGNSSLSYKNNWQKGVTRIVRLNGEAYFKVRKQPATQAKFQVITNDLTVEVLGTAFNINTHKNETRVFLEEGAVKVNLDHQADKAVSLAPGEAMRYSAAHQRLTPPEKIVQEQQPNWRAGFLQFKETPLQSILDELSQAHQLEFVILDSVLTETKFDLTLPTENMEETMAILGKSIGASILRVDTKYIIDKEPDKKE